MSQPQCCLQRSYGIRDKGNSMSEKGTMWAKPPYTEAASQNLNMTMVSLCGHVCACGHTCNAQVYTWCPLVIKSYL